MKRIGLALVVGCLFTTYVRASDVEKKGCIITNKRDTIDGAKFLKKELVSISSLQFFSW